MASLRLTMYKPHASPTPLQMLQPPPPPPPLPHPAIRERLHATPALVCLLGSSCLRCCKDRMLFELLTALLLHCSTAAAAAAAANQCGAAAAAAAAASAVSAPSAPEEPFEASVAAMLADAYYLQPQPLTGRSGSFHRQICGCGSCGGCDRLR